MTGQDLRPFKIVHLSDLHLTTSDEDARSEPKLFGKLTGMNSAFQRIVKEPQIKDADLILVTGDITDTGDIKAWRIFWDTLRSAGVPQSRVLVIPGNHDVCCLGIRRLFLPGGHSWLFGIRLPVFDRRGNRQADMEKAIAGLELGGQPIKFPWVRNPDPRVVIFGLNSNNLGNSSVMDNALGKIGFYQLENFARLLHKYHEVPVKIVALHHSPNLPEAETMKKRFGKDYHIMNRLFSVVPQDQRRMLRLLCVTHAVRLIVHGHVHLYEDRRVNGIRIVGVPPATEPITVETAGHGYEFYSYVVGGQANTVSVLPVRVLI